MMKKNLLLLSHPKLQRAPGASSQNAILPPRYGHAAPSDFKLLAARALSAGRALFKLPDILAQVCESIALLNA